MTRQQKQYWKKLRDYESRTLKAIRRCFVETESNSWKRIGSIEICKFTGVIRKYTEPETHDDCTACYIQSEHKRIWPRIALGGLVLALITVFGAIRCAHAQGVDLGAINIDRVKPSTYEKKVILAIIGEAEGENQEGKEAIACAIHARGTLKGVYGLHAPRVKHHKYSALTFKKAKEAWDMAQDQEYCQALIGDATGWGSNSDMKKFKRMAWFKRCVITAHLGGHWFYKERA